MNIFHAYCIICLSIYSSFYATVNLYSDSFQSKLHNQHTSPLNTSVCTPLIIFYRSFPIPWWDSLVAQMVKRLSATQETGVRFLGWEDPLEKAIAAHFSTLAWKIPWTEEPSRLESMGSQRVGHD